MAEVNTALPVPTTATAVTLLTFRDGGTVDARVPTPASELLARYRPPFDLRSDMLLVAAVCPVAPLRRVFLDVDFFTFAGKALLVAWFSRIKEICYYDQSGNRRCLGSAETVLYNELNVAALLQRRAVFVPGIYATDDLTILVAHRYGMPKHPVKMTVRVEATRFTSTVMAGRRRSFASARLRGNGRGVAKMIAPFWPWRAWPACFPGDRNVRALIQTTPRIQAAFVDAGQLALGTAWLPQVVPLLPVGLYLSDMWMQLPPPDE